MIVDGQLKMSNFVLLDGVDTCEFLMMEGMGSSKVEIEIIRRDAVNSQEAFLDKIYGNALSLLAQALASYAVRVDVSRKLI